MATPKKSLMMIRNILSYAPLFRIVTKPADYKKGISAYMRVKNEEDWIKYSLISIKDFVDEIIVGDNGSTDNTLQIINGLIDQGLNIKLFDCSHMKMREMSEFILEKTSYSYAVRWDSDMVARTDGDFSITKLRKNILNIRKDKYYLFYISHIRLTGDLFHQDPNMLIDREEYIHTNSDKLCFVHPHKYEAIKSPKYYKVLIVPEIYSFHFDIKSSYRMLLRNYWIDWMEMKDYETFPDLESFVTYKIKQENKYDCIEAAAKNYVVEYCKKLIPFDKNKYGDYPSILKDQLLNPKYKIIYSNGKIIGRNDVISE